MSTESRTADISKTNDFRRVLGHFYLIQCVAASPRVCPLCLLQRLKAPNRTAFASWRERQPHKGTEKDPGTHPESSGWTQRTVWALMRLPFWWKVRPRGPHFFALNVVLRREQTEAAAAGAGAEPGGGPEGHGRQRGGRAQTAADPGPTGRVQSQSGGAVLGDAPPAGAQRPRWGSHTGTDFGPFLLAKVPHIHTIPPCTLERCN